MLRRVEDRRAARSANTFQIRLQRHAATALILGILGCESGPSPEAAVPAAPADSVSSSLVGAEDRAVELVDTGLPAAPAGEEGWMYSQSVEADLDHDGQPERVVLAAKVELYRGRPAWDDGQPWQVYVEESDGTRTDLYRRFVQLGTVDLRVGRADEGRGASVILIEHLPDRLSVYELEYAGPGELRTTEAFARSLDPTGEVASPALP